MVESNWKEYYGSSKWLTQTIVEEGKSKVKREILHLSKSSDESTLIEIKEQLHNHVLTKKFNNGIKQFYNKNIMGKFKEEYFTRPSGKHRPSGRGNSLRMD